MAEEAASSVCRASEGAVSDGRKGGRSPAPTDFADSSVTDSSAACTGTTSDGGVSWSRTADVEGWWMWPFDTSGRSGVGALEPLRRCRNAIATSSSIELECVFFSLTPNSGNKSMITPGFTSSSRASSLIRIFFIEETAS